MPLNRKFCRHPQQPAAGPIEIEIVLRTWPKTKTTATLMRALPCPTLKTAGWCTRTTASVGKNALRFATKVTNFTKSLLASLQYTFVYLHVELIGRSENSFRIVLQLTNFQLMVDNVRPVGSKEVQPKNA